MINMVRFAAWAWILTLHYFVVQVIVALAWQRPYSLARNAISDLGNSVCAPYHDEYICSPLFWLMNASFILLGLLQAVGALLLWRAHTSRLVRSGLVMLVLAGIGTIIVGLFPENTVGPMHLLGAVLPFVFGNIGIVLCGFIFPKGALRYASMVAGAVALIACALLVQEVYLGLGFGGMERIVAYPQTIWMIGVGLYLLRIKAR